MAERFDIQRNSRNADELRATLDQAESKTDEFAKGVAAGIRYAVGGGVAPFPGEKPSAERSTADAIAERTRRVAERQAAPDGVGADAGAGGATPATTQRATPA